MFTERYTEYRLHHARTSLITAIIIAVFLGIGAVLLVWVQNETYWQGHETLRTLIRDFGSILIVTLTVLIVWEVALRRSFRDELLNVVGLSRQIHDAGLVNLPWSPLDIPWKELILKSNEIDLLLAYGKTWRGNNKQFLCEFLQKPSSRLRVVLPDHTADHVVEELTERSSKRTTEELRGKIENAEDHFIALASDYSAKGHLTLWRMNIAPVFALYRFDDIVIISFYSHKKLVGVPHLVCKKGGQIFDFALTQLETIISGDAGRARAIFDNRSPIILEPSASRDGA